MIYCQEIKKGKIINFTKDEEIAISLGWINKVDEQELETAYDGQIYLKGYAPQKPEPTKEEQEQNRARAYKEEVDPLHSRKQRKIILEEWSEDDEREYVLKVKELSDKIAKEYPYEAKKQ